MSTQTGSKRRLYAIAALLTLALVADLRRAPAEQLAARSAIAAIHLYQATYARMGVRCRFTPTCSHYGETVVREFGAVRGGWMAMTRVLRCGPWTPMGTVDPPLQLGGSSKSFLPSSVNSTQHA